MFVFNLSSLIKSKLMPSLGHGEEEEEEEESIDPLPEKLKGSVVGVFDFFFFENFQKFFYFTLALE